MLLSINYIIFFRYTTISESAVINDKFETIGVKKYSER